MKPVILSRAVKALVWDKSMGHCFYCGANYLNPFKGEITIDHVIPRCKGGSDHISNLVLCCAECNRNKHTFTLSEWAERTNRQNREFFLEECGYSEGEYQELSAKWTHGFYFERYNWELSTGLLAPCQIDGLKESYEF